MNPIPPRNLPSLEQAHGWLCTVFQNSGEKLTRAAVARCEILGGVVDPKDVLQEVYLKTAEDLRDGKVEYRGEKELRGLLSVRIQNIAKDESRKSRRAFPMAHDDLAETEASANHSRGTAESSYNFLLNKLSWKYLHKKLSEKFPEAHRNIEEFHKKKSRNERPKSADYNRYNEAVTVFANQIVKSQDEELSELEFDQLKESIKEYLDFLK